MAEKRGVLALGHAVGLCTIPHRPSTSPAYIVNVVMPTWHWYMPVSVLQYMFYSICNIYYRVVAIIAPIL